MLEFSTDDSMFIASLLDWSSLLSPIKLEALGLNDRLIFRFSELRMFDV